MNTRFKKIYKVLENNNLDAIALIPGSNFKYLTDGSFPLMERPTVLIITTVSYTHLTLPTILLV